MYREFLKKLYSGKDKTDQILIWTLPDRRSQFCRTIDQSISAIEQRIGNSDVFFGVGTSPKDYGYRNRCLRENISGMPALYLDIDYADKAHKKKKLPPSVEEAIELTKFGDLEPSLIVHSGHGIHAYYLFNEFWHFNSDEERLQAAELSYRLHLTAKAKAEEKGYEVDSVFDLARVLRVAGTYNRKNKDDIIQAKIIESNEKKYSAKNFDAILLKTEPMPVQEEFAFKKESKKKSIKTKQKPRQKQEKQSSNYIKDSEVKNLASKLIITSDRKIDENKLSLLKDNCTGKFQKTWENNRPELNDTSPSGYDGSLLLFALSNKFTAQDCVDLIISFRKKHNFNLKLDNRQYYSRSILNAQSAMLRQKKFSSSSSEINTNTNTNYGKNNTPNNVLSEKEFKQKCIEFLNRRLLIEITEVIKYIEDPDDIFFVKGMAFDERTKTSKPNEIKIGSIASILDSRVLRQKLTALTNIVITTKLKAEEWAEIAQYFINAAIEIEVSPESTDLGAIEHWLREYLSDKEKLNLKDAGDTKEPIYHNQTWHIFKEKFVRWCKTQKECEWKPKQFILTLRRFGCDQTKVNITIGNKRTSRAVWRIPAKII